MRGLAALVVLGFAAFVLFAYLLWAFRDAKRRHKSAFFVLVAVVFFFPFGLIAWLLFRPPAKSDQEYPTAPAGGWQRRVTATAHKNGT